MAMGLFFGMDFSEQDERARQRMHESKIELLNGIGKVVNKTLTGEMSEEDICVQTIRGMTPKQKTKILAKLEKESSYWLDYPAPIEQSMINKAVEEFRKGNYKHASIYRYITAEDISEAS